MKSNSMHIRITLVQTYGCSFNAKNILLSDRISIWHIHNKPQNVLQYDVLWIHTDIEYMSREKYHLFFPKVAYVHL